MRLVNIVLLILTTFIFYSCSSGVDECDEDSPAVQKAKALDANALKNLLEEVNVLLPSQNIFEIPINEELPLNIKSLSPQHLSPGTGKTLHVYLHGCNPDNKVILTIDAIAQVVTIRWGDWASPTNGSEVLWPKT